MSDSEANRKNDCLAYTYAFFCQLLFPLTQIYAIQHNFSVFEINIMRGILILLLTYFIAKVKDIDLYYSIRNSFWVLILRSSLLVLWIIVMTCSYYYISFAVLYSINVCGSISAFVWDSYIFKIHINKQQKIGVICGVIGAFFVINANAFMSLLDQNFEIITNFEYFKTKQIIQTVFIGLILLVTTMGMGFAFSLSKSVKLQKDGCQFNIIFAFMLMACSGVGLMFESKRQPKSMQVYLNGFLLTGLPQTIATQLGSMAFASTQNSGIVGLFMTVSVVVSYLIGIFRYGQILNVIALLGSILILTGISMTILLKNEPKLEQINNQKQVD